MEHSGLGTFSVSVIDVQHKDIDVGLARYPQLAEAFHVWERWRELRSAPIWESVQLVELPPALVPNTVVVDVIDGGEDLRFRFWGTALVNLYDEELTGTLFSEATRPGFIEGAWPQYRRVMDTGTPSFYEVTLRRPNNIVAHRANLRLPVHDALGRVSKIITVAEIESRLTTRPRASTVH